MHVPRMCELRGFELQFCCASLRFDDFPVDGGRRPAGILPSCRPASLSGGRRKAAPKLCADTQPRAARWGGLSCLPRSSRRASRPREGTMTKFSGITPSGHVQLGNHLGAIRRWAAESAPADLYFVSDLHAMTTTHNPARLRSLAGEHLAVLVAAGIAPE